MSELLNAEPIKILIVEDNPGDVDLMRAALRRCKVLTDLTVARDGVEALAMLRNVGEYADVERPDMILLDLNLPRKNGHELLAEIKTDPALKRIPVVVVTSSKAKEDVATTYDLHANCFITKPVNLQQFMRLVESIENFWFTIVKLPVAAG
jgi:two-component system response regulator